MWLLALSHERLLSLSRTQVKLELHSTSESGQHEIRVCAITRDGKEHSLVRVILKGSPSMERDLNFRFDIRHAAESVH